MFFKKRPKPASNLTLADIDPAIAEMLDPGLQLRTKYAAQTGWLKQQIRMLECSPADYSLSNKQVLAFLEEWLSDTQFIDYLLQSVGERSKNQRDITIYEYR